MLPMKNLKLTIKGQAYNKNNTNENFNSPKADPIKANRIKELQNTERKTGKKRKILRFMKRLFVLFLLAGLIGLGIFAYQRWDRLQRFNDSITANNPSTDVCSNIFDPKCWSQAFSPKLNQHDEMTGVLIVGLDTRGEGAVQGGLMNTDSIMVGLYHHRTKKTMLLSLPRDLYVPYSINGQGPYRDKINAIYATGHSRNDVEDGFDLLQETVENIIGQPIQYRVIIKLEGVKDAVDAVGGVEIDVPTYLKVQYPNDYRGQQGAPDSTWLYYEFQPGIQHMDGEHALVWARFRSVIKGDMNYASDFSRADRQQQVLNALKEKALDEKGSDLDKAEKYWSIFKSINKNVEANVGLEELFAAFNLTSEADLDPINVVLDPEFGGLNQIIYHPPTDQTNGYYLKFKDETFKATQSYLALIWEYPELYDESTSILIANQLGRAYTSIDSAIKFRDQVYQNSLPFISSNLTMVSEQRALENQGTVIVDFTKGEKAGTTKYLAEYFEASKIIEDPENYGYAQSGYKEDIKVIVTPAPNVTANNK